jgi:hypothetical protein
MRTALCFFNLTALFMKSRMQRTAKFIVIKAAPFSVTAMTRLASDNDLNDISGYLAVALVSTANLQEDLYSILRLTYR